jgi:hypothetical protein
MSRGEDWRVYLAYQGPTRGVSGATRRATVRKYTIHLLSACRRD